MAGPSSISEEITETPDEAAIKTIIESVGNLADMKDFDSLEKLYVEMVKMDYTSLFGGEPELKKASTQMKEWAGLVQGFKQTRHAISNIRVTLNEGGLARAKADVVVTLWRDSSFWQVSGYYDYELAKQGLKWNISSHRFNLEKETGCPEIGAAIKQTSRN